MTNSEFPTSDDASAPDDVIASAEDQAWIAGLLGTLRASDTPIPAEVANRLDQALEAESMALSANAPREGSQRKPGRGSRWLAVAAAAAVLLGGTAVYRQANTTNQTGSTVASDSFTAQTTQATPLAPVPTAALQTTSTADASATRVIDGSGVTASKDSVGTSITAVLSSINAAEAMNQPVPVATPSLAQPRAWSDCLSAVAGLPKADLSDVVTGISYQGRPADVLVRRVDSTHIEVWVIALGCTTSKTDLLDHEVLAA
jgi:hypothetical protein